MPTPPTPPATAEELLALMERGAQREPTLHARLEAAAEEARSLVPVSAGQGSSPDGHPRSQVWTWVDVLRPFAPKVPEPELVTLFDYALLGVAVGFGDRNLSPYLDAHQAIVPLLLDDIARVYRQLQMRESHYSPEELVFRAYDYGIHKAYYLDWTLYLSRDLY